MGAAKFTASLKNFVGKTERRERELYNRVVAHVGRSIRSGSATTGAPGQPVRSGALLASWFENGNRASRVVEFISEISYADIIENNLRGAELRSEVGGFHSVKLTQFGFNRIVRFELDKMGNRDFAVFKGGALREPATGRFTKDPR